MLILKRGKGKKKKEKRKRREKTYKTLLLGQYLDPRDQVHTPRLLHFQPHYSQSQEQSFTYRAFHTFLSSANCRARMSDSVGTCQFLFMSWLPPQRLLGPRPSLSLQDLSNFKIGSFLRLLLRHWGGLLLPTQGILWELYLRKQSMLSNMKVEKDGKILC